MQPDAEGGPFPNYSVGHHLDQAPPSPPDTLDTPPYVFPPGPRHRPYFHLPHGLLTRRYKTDVQYRREPVDAVPTSYPESSQRTLIHDGPYPSSYGMPVLGQFDTPDIHVRPSVIHENLTNADRDQMTPISPTVHQPPISSPPDLYLYPAAPSEAHGPRDQHIPDQHIFPTDALYPASSADSYPTEGSSSIVPAPFPGRSHLEQTTVFEVRRRSPSQFDIPFLLPPGSPSNGLDRQSYCDSPVQSSHYARVALPSPSLSSIPMRNTSGWSHASLSNLFEAQNPPSFASREPSNSSTRLTPDSDSSASAGLSGSQAVGYLTPDTLPSSSSATSSSNPPLKKKKSKMHECEICGKKFPRPSGLQTHMNTHNNVKPFPCGFPGCHRTFTVRSNAKRHLRTHGVIPLSSSEPAIVPYVVGFSTPTVMPPLVPSHQMSEVPFKLRWMPPSLTSRTNASALTSLSDPESDSDDANEHDATMNWRSALSIPLRPVLPSSYTDDIHEQYEERNSYLEAKSHPYHPSQFRVLPGPAVVAPRSRSVV